MPEITREILITVMKQLAQKRPLFHSEADFQFSLAWELKEELKDRYKIRLEKPDKGLPTIKISPQEEMQSEQGKDNNCSVDIWIETPDSSEIYPIEVKYPTKEINIEIAQEGFKEKYDLKDHAADNNGHYAFWEDVYRIQYIQNKYDKFKKGFVILLELIPLIGKSLKQQQPDTSRLCNGMDFARNALTVF